MWIWSCLWIWKRAEMGMLLGGSVKDLKVCAAGEFRYACAKLLTEPHLLYFFTLPHPDLPHILKVMPTWQWSTCGGASVDQRARHVSSSARLPFVFPGWANKLPGALFSPYKELALCFKETPQSASNFTQLVEMQRLKVVWLLLQCELECVNPCA